MHVALGLALVLASQESTHPLHLQPESQMCGGSCPCPGAHSRPRPSTEWSSLGPQPRWALSSHLLCLCLLSHVLPVQLPTPVLSPWAPAPAPWASWSRRWGGTGAPASPGPRVSGPLAGTVGGLLHCVGHPGGVGGTEELHRAPLQAHLPAALAEAGVGVDVIVVDAGRRASPIAGH